MALVGSASLNVIHRSAITFEFCIKIYNSSRARKSTMPSRKDQSFAKPQPSCLYFFR